MTTTRQERIAHLQRVLLSSMRQQRRDMEMHHDIPGWEWEEEYEQHSRRIKKIQLVLAELTANN